MRASQATALLYLCVGAAVSGCSEEPVDSLAEGARRSDCAQPPVDSTNAPTSPDRGQLEPDGSAGEPPRGQPPSDEDAGAPGSPGRPCTKTIGPGDDIASNIGGAGSVLCLESGAYHQRITVDGHGTDASPIVIQAAPGAMPVIDGQSKIPGNEWAALVTLNGSYIVVDGLEIANSAGRCVDMIGPHNQIHRSKVHHCYQNGVLARGDDSVIESNEVWESGLVNLNGRCKPSGNPCFWPSGISSARDVVDGITNRAVLRGNVSHDNWGEGISTFEAEGTLIEGNVSYNNWSVNLYVSDTRNAVVRNNLVYKANPTGGRGGNLTIADEVASKPRSANILLTNNIVYGTSVCVVCWTLVTGLRDIDAHHNTIVAGSLEVNPANGTNITQSANCNLSASAVPGLGTVTPGSLKAQSFAGASCPSGTGANVSTF